MKTPFETTNTNRFGNNRNSSTVANYLKLTKTNIGQINTNTVPSSHLNHGKELKIIADKNKVDEEVIQLRQEFNNTLKYNDNDYNNVYKADANDSKRRFQKYQWQRRASATTYTVATSSEAQGDNAAAKSQVNLNVAKQSERETSTNIPETTAHLTTESPATHFPKRTKVLKRPAISSISSPNITSNVTETSFTNFNVSHTETPYIFKHKLTTVEPQILESDTLTFPEITQAQTPILSQTSSRKPKYIRKVIRKLSGPVEKISELTSEREIEKSSITTSEKRNVYRYGFNRSMKLKPAKEPNFETAKKYEEFPEKKKKQVATSRGKNRFMLPTEAVVRFGTYKVNRFTISPQFPTENPSANKDHSVFKEGEYSDNGDIVQDALEEEITLTTTISPKMVSITTSTASTTKFTAENDSEVTKEPENTFKEEISESTVIKTDHSVELSKMVLSDSFKFITSSHGIEDSNEPLLKLHNRVKQDSANMVQEEGVLSTRWQHPKLDIGEEETETTNPVDKLHYKVKPNGEQERLSDHLKFLTNESEVHGSDDPLFNLRSTLKKEIIKNNEEESVGSVKFKKPLQTNDVTTTLSYEVEHPEIETTSTKYGLNLRKIRNKIQTNLEKGDKNEDVASSRLKKILTEKNSSSVANASSGSATGKEADHESSADIEVISGDGETSGKSRDLIPRKPFIPKSKLKAENGDYINKDAAEYDTTPLVHRKIPTFRRKLVAKRPYNPSKHYLSVLSATTTSIPTTEKKNKYALQKFYPFNGNDHNFNEGSMRTDSKVYKLPANNRFKSQKSAGGQNGKGYIAYDEALENEEVVEEEKSLKPIQMSKPNFERPPGFFKRPETTFLQKPSILSRVHGPGNNAEEKVQDEKDEENDNEDEEGEEEEELEDDVEEEAEKASNAFASHQFKNEHIPPGARHSFNIARVANTPYNPASVSPTIPSNKLSRFGSSVKSTFKPRVINQPLGVSVPSLTIKHVANDFKRTPVLIPTKPALFINHNTRAYERKYSGPTAESAVEANIESNPFIEDLNIEVVNARNKKIFYTNSKKHIPHKPKAILPLAKQNDNTQDNYQQQTNLELENDDNEYQSSSPGVATTTSTTTTITKTHTQQPEHEQQKNTLDNILIGPKNSEVPNQSNVNNLNEIYSQDGFTTTPAPSTTLLHIFTLSDAEHTTQNPSDDIYQDVPRLIVEGTKPKHKVVEINRIVEVNSKEEKLRRKSKANTIVAIEGSETYKVESLPHVEQLGEISVVKYVHQVNGSDVTIDGRSTDYAPTEPAVADSSQPVSYSLSGATTQQRYGKALFPEILREAIETSTISLEGLFETVRKSKVLNTIEFIRPEVDNKQNFKIMEYEPQSLNNLKSKSSTSKPTDTSKEFFNILQSVDEAKINLENNSDEIGTTESADITISFNLPSSFALTTIGHQLLTTTAVSPTLAPEILKQESSTLYSEENRASTVVTALFPQYVRPIVPLLRPESNESSPLVISIANLDKVILSKVGKMVNGAEVEEDEQHQESQTHQKQDNNTPSDSYTETPGITAHHYTPPTAETQIPQNSDMNETQAEFSSSLASVIRAPLTNSRIQNEKNFPREANVFKSALEQISQVTQTDLYTINQNNVDSTTSSTIGSKISETVSFSSETKVVRRKQSRIAKLNKI